MFVIAFGIATDARAEHPAKAPSQTSVSPAETDTDAIAVYRSPKIRFIVNACVGAVTPVSDVQPENMFTPTLSSPSGSRTESIRQQFENAALPISVTLSGTDNDESCVHPANASSPIDVTLSPIVMLRM